MKKFALIMILAVLLTALSSCGGDSGNEKETTLSLEELVDSISQAINDGTYGTLPNLAPEVEVKVYDTYAEITGCKNAIGGITIPAEYDGKPVTKIASEAFLGYSSMTSIVLPDSLTEIGDRAFLGCMGLTAVTIPDSVKVIGESAFYGCPALRAVNIGAGVTEIKSTAFGYCLLLDTINVAAANTAFAGADGVLFSTDMKTLISYPCGKAAESYAIPAGVTTVKNFAFAYAQNLMSLTVPDSVTSLGDNTFRSCTKLESVTLGTGLTFIGANTFISCTSLKSIVIPEGVKTIGYIAEEKECGGSFTGCSALTEVSLPATLTNIYLLSFSECKALTKISFAGSAADWAKVSVSEGNDNIKVAAVSYGK